MFFICLLFFVVCFLLFVFCCLFFVFCFLFFVFYLFIPHVYIFCELFRRVWLGFLGASYGLVMVRVYPKGRIIILVGHGVQ
jgi:hypothetical protein